MMNFGYSLDKFLENEHFVDWVNNPDSIYKEYWEQYFKQNPQEQKNAEDAIVFIKQLGLAELISVRQVKETEKKQIWHSITSELLNTKLARVHKTKKTFYWIAASVIILLSSAILFKLVSSTAPTTVTGQNYENMVATNANEIVNTNNTGTYKIVYLSDGSIINLAPGSSVKHQRLFTGDKREVYLKGEAFFKVSKNKAKPFYVYTGNIVTRVVGTSFNVSSSPQGNIIVAVRTGKVMVYKKGTEEHEENIKMLYPMQQCTYKASSDVLNVSTVADKQSLEDKGIKENEGNLNFEDVYMEDVFTAIEKRFGVVLIYNKNEFKSVYITVSVENESLENMLKIICKTAGATYRIDNDFVFIDKTEKMP